MDPAELLSKIIDDGRLAVPLADLESATDHSARSIREAASSLDSRGIATLWEEAPEGPALVLTLHTLSTLDLEPDDTGDRYRPRERRPRPISLGGSSRTVQASQIVEDADSPDWFSSQVDPGAVNPWRAAAMNEWTRRELRDAEAEIVDARPGSERHTRAILKARRMAPLVLKGLGVPWPHPHEPGQRCDQCQGETRHSFVCLVCMSTDADAFAPAIPAPTLRSQAKREAMWRGLDGGTERKPKATRKPKGKGQPKRRRAG